MDRSLGFGSTAGNYAPCGAALFRLGFPPAPALQCLNLATHGNSQAHSTKGTPSLTQASALTACRSTVSGSRFTPLPGSFSPFPHGTTSLSVAAPYLALEGGPPGFPQDFPCPAVLRFHAHGVSGISCTGLSPSSVALPSGVPLYLEISDSARAHTRPPARPYNPYRATVHALYTR
jgi:hypothetical protein